MGRTGIELVLFDFGGTLFHPAPGDWLVRAAVNELELSLTAAQIDSLGWAYHRAGIPGGPIPPIPPQLTAAYAVRDLGPDEHRAAWVGLLARAELDPTIPVPDPHALAEAVYEHTLDPLGWVPYADAAPTLAALADRGVAVGLISNIGFDLREILHVHGFSALADTATLSVEVGRMKPDPRLFRAALDRFGVAPEAAVMVGDSPEADGGAAALGMEVLIVELTPPGTEHGLMRVLDLLETDLTPT